MVAAKTTADLLEEVIAAAQLHAEDGEILDGRLSNADVLRFASKLLSTDIAALLVATRSERWCWQDQDVPLVAGQSHYRIPSRALGSGVAQVIAVRGGDEHELAPMGTGARLTGGDTPRGYAYEGDSLVVVPTPRTSGGALRVRYPRQPARLVEPSACAVVASRTGTAITTTEAAPTSWGASPRLDVTRGTTHGDLLATDLTASVSGSTVTVPAGIPSAVGAGDVVSRAGEGCVMPLPEVVFHLLVDLVVVEVLRRIGDDPQTVMDAVQAATARRQHVRDLLEPRNRGAKTRQAVRPNSPLRRRI